MCHLCCPQRRIGVRYGHIDSHGINALLYATMNNGAVLDWDGGTGDLLGGTSMADIANGAATGWAEAASYFQFAWGDLMGFFGIFDS